MKHWRRPASAPAPPWIGYIRVSTEEQADSGLSLESQEEKVRGMAIAKSVDLSEVITDAGYSAKSLDRPGIQRVMELCREREIAGVIIAKLDRITRYVPDLGRLVEVFTANDVSLISCDGTADTSTAAGRMVMNLVATVAQWEREVICERTKDALQAKIRRGEHGGNIRYGYRHAEGGFAVPHPDEQAVIARIQELRGQGLSLKKIADQLNEEGFRTRRGSEWRLQFVHRVLESAGAEYGRAA